jgi:hypothetical protein
MARRSQRAVRPKTLTTLEAPVEGDNVVVGRENTKLGRTLEEEYAHIRGDLTRILTISALILGGMLVLKFVVGL